jgi:REP element-mobilizing transposase RayT
VDLSQGKEKPKRRSNDLLRGRQSLAGANYFVTFCTFSRAKLLTSERARSAAPIACINLVEAKDAIILAGTVMPDHVHLFLQLGTRLSLDRVVAKWKSRIHRSDPDIIWQANFFEHRLRSEEAMEPYAWYIFMNPYVAGLLPLPETWAGWWPEPGIQWRFLGLARQGPTPQPEWMQDVDKKTGNLVTGE